MFDMKIIIVKQNMFYEADTFEFSPVLRFTLHFNKRSRKCELRSFSLERRKQTW